MHNFKWKSFSLKNVKVFGSQHCYWDSQQFSGEILNPSHATRFSLWTWLGSLPCLLCSDTGWEEPWGQLPFLDPVLSDMWSFKWQMPQSATPSWVIFLTIFSIPFFLVSLFTVSFVDLKCYVFSTFFHLFVFLPYFLASCFNFAF